MINKTRAVARKYGPKLGAAALTLPFTVLSFAQETGSGAGTAGAAAVNEAKADMLTVALAILAAMAAVWAIFKVIGMFGRR